MASPLLLPAHADIHEFSVMFTRSVKKKAKDWHDGYLKWHTFNYRAILYDDQRKQVANEFFPNKIISSNSDLEFAGAIVEIGDQLETLQANLEHVYRNSVNMESPLRQTSTPGTAHALQADSPRTPALARSMQKRTYPTTAVRHTIVRPIQMPVLTNQPHSAKETQGTPLKPVQLVKRIGIVRPTNSPLAPQRLHYPLAKSQVSPAEFQQEALGPGWFARQDQHAAQRGVVSTEVPVPGRRPKDIQVTRQKRPSERRVNGSDRRTSSKGSVQTRVSATSLLSGAATCCTPPDQILEASSASDIIIAAPSVQGSSDAPEARKRSQLDPTRSLKKPRPRTLLAARNRGLPASASASNEDSLPRKYPVEDPTDSEAMYDPDLSRWVPDIGSKSTSSLSSSHSPDQGLHDSQSARCTSLAVKSSNAQENMPVTVSDIAESRSQTPVEKLPVQSTEMPLVVTTNTSLQPTAFADKVAVLVEPVEDEDGFIEPVAFGGTRLVSKVATNGKRRKVSRPVESLIEQFPLSQGLLAPQELNMTLPESRAASPLFLPDTDPGQDESHPTSPQPGLFTQLATRAAKDIAKKSSIARLGPARNSGLLIKSGLQKLRKMETTSRVEKPAAKSSGRPQQPHSNSKAIKKSGISQRPTIHRTMDPPAIETKKAPAVVIPAQDESDNTMIVEHMFPATPVEVETCDLDAMFDEVDQESTREAVKGRAEMSDAAVTSVVHSPRRVQSLQSQVRIADVADFNAGQDSATDFRLATQMAARAPDFMSAKSFQLGARLQLDRPIAAIGMSAREIAALDLSTQLSES